MKGKKILILGKLPPPYMGPAVATEIILNSALKNTFELVHLNTKINTELDTFGKWSIGKVFKNISLYFRMLKLVSGKKPDLVLIPISQTTTGFFKDSIFILLASLFRRKILLHLRGSQFKVWADNSSGLNRAYVKFILKKAKGVIVLGNKLKYIFEPYFSSEKIFVVPNGADYTFPAKTKSLEVNILYFSNLLAAKGVVDVFKAIEILSGKIKANFSIDFVGEWYLPEDKRLCDEIINKKTLPIRVHSSKSGAGKFKFLSDADIFVFPPREPEGHPWSIVEAMAAGLPIISTDKGAITESVIDRCNGFIIEPGRPEQIAEKLKLLIENESLRKKMGEEGRNLYLSNFTESKMVEKLSAAFTKIIES
ncbi:MAG TPA: glycosyltransferase family 4 protein [Bacteroidia bacterium]|jgi:glycosyltransferase involved in cell wall biosynthesis|nr:glycosyltransferase family 4 protein [Bacteroidia bacterium]